MPAIEIGRICVKLSGREIGKKCVIVDVIDKSYVLVTGPKAVTGIRRRRTNVNHIRPLQDMIEIKRAASDEDVEKTLKKQAKLEDMKQEVSLVPA